MRGRPRVARILKNLVPQQLLLLRHNVLDAPVLRLEHLSTVSGYQLINRLQVALAARVARLDRGLGHARAARLLGLDRDPLGCVAPSVAAHDHLLAHVRNDVRPRHLLVVVQIARRLTAPCRLAAAQIYLGVLREHFLHYDLAFWHLPRLTRL